MKQSIIDTFRDLGFAYHAMEKDGNMCCILNAANEIAVDAFLKDKIKFLQISDVIESCMAKVNYIGKPTLDDLIVTNEETRKFASTLV